MTFNARALTSLRRQLNRLSVCTAESGLRYSDLTYELVSSEMGTMMFSPNTPQPTLDEDKQLITFFAASARTKWRRHLACAPYRPGLFKVRLIRYHKSEQPQTVKPKVYPGFLISREFDSHGPLEHWLGESAGKAKPDKRGEWAEPGADRYVVQVTVYKQ